jgi:hypothetical protein
LTKIERATNSLRYFGQLRAFFAEREKIVEIGAIEQAERHAIVSIRTDEKPDIVRWISPRDIRKIKRFSHRR